MEPVKQQSNANIIDSLLVANSLTYDIGRSLNISRESNYTQENFIIGNNGITGPGKRIERVLNTSSAFVDGPECYLCLKVTLTGGPLAYLQNNDHCWFGNQNSAISLIDEIHIKSKDGVDIELSRNNGLIREMELRNTYSSSYLRNQGSVFGCTGQNESEFVHLTLDQQSFQTQRLMEGYNLAIPMKHLSGLFDYDEKYLPSQLCAGMSISITFAPMAKVFNVKGSFTNGGDGFLPGLSYEVSDVFLRMKTYELSDSIQSKLASIAEKEGLKILFNTYWDETQTGVTSRASLNIRKNISQALSLHARTQREDFYNNATESPTRSGEYSYTGLQWRHGSENFPRDTIKRMDDNYMQSQASWSKSVKHPSNAIDFVYDFTEGNFTTVGYDFQRSNMGMSGISLSNSKSLSMNAEYSDAGVSKRVDLFLKYSRLLSVFISNSVIED